MRDRRDVPLLAQGLLAELAIEAGSPAPPRLSEATLAAITARRWPGNVRELKTALQYALVMAADGETIEPEHLPQPPFASNPLEPPSPPEGPTALSGRKAAEAEALRQALARADGNLTIAARTLGVARSTLYRMMARYGVGEPPRKRRSA